MSDAPRLDGLVPDSLAPAVRRIFLEQLDVPVDIGFHPFEIGNPQRLLISIEVRLDEAAFVASDDPAEAWDYDVLRSDVIELAAGRRFNLQETLVREVYALVAARAGVVGLRVSTCKPDVYPDCKAVGVELSSF